VHIDARPSDSIAIALRLTAPIFAAEDLLVEPSEEDEEAALKEDPRDFALWKTSPSAGYA
jgi:bifunctional DNase/RNase